MRIYSAQYSFPVFPSFMERIRFIENMIRTYFEAQERDGIDDIQFFLLPEYSLGWRIKEITSDDVRLGLEHLMMITRDFKNTVLISGTGGFASGKGVYNQGFVFYEGKKLGEYSKQYPFGNEPSRGIQQGFTPPILSIKAIKFTVIVCADLWYPELLRQKPFLNVDAVFVPVQSVVDSPDLTAYGYFLWKSLMITRAKENVVLMVSSDWNEGRILEGRDYFAVGASFIIDPSFKFKNNESNNPPKLREGKGENTILELDVNVKDIRDYKAYRRSRGLLPQ